MTGTSPGRIPAAKPAITARLESQSVGEPPRNGERQTTYRRSVIVGPRQIEFEDVALPEPGPHQVLVRVAAAALCTWEQRVYAGIDTWSYPLVGGHEFSGEVTAVGSGVAQPLAPGDQVAVA